MLIYMSCQTKSYFDSKTLRRNLKKQQKLYVIEKVMLRLLVTLLFFLKIKITIFITLNQYKSFCEYSILIKHIYLYMYDYVCK